MAEFARILSRFAFARQSPSFRGEREGLFALWRHRSGDWRFAQTRDRSGVLFISARAGLLWLNVVALYGSFLCLASAEESFVIDEDNMIATRIKRSKIEEEKAPVKTVEGVRPV